MDVSVIIVNWNSKEYVQQCLASLYRHCRSFPFEVVVVDGASFDGCGEMLAKEFPSVVFVQSEVNGGFGAANNLAVRHSSGNFLFFLNPDTLLHENSLQILVDALRSNCRAVAVGCRLLNRDGTIQTSCVQSFPTVLNQALDSEFLRERFPEWKLWGVSPLYDRRQISTEVDVISGACMLVRRNAFEKVGGFTESYFMYGEDLDLCYKLNQAGGSLVYVPSTSLTHFGGGSSGQAAGNFSNTMMRHSVCQFMRSHYGKTSCVMYRAATAMSAVVRLILIGPMLIFGRSVVRHGTSSWRKWWAILQWSLGKNPRPPIKSSGAGRTRKPVNEVARPAVTSR